MKCRLHREPIDNSLPSPNTLMLTGLDFCRGGRIIRSLQTRPSCCGFAVNSGLYAQSTICSKLAGFVERTTASNSLPLEYLPY